MKASPARILLGLLLGVLFGYICMKSHSPLLAKLPAVIAPLGTLFINAIRLCVIPLVTSSLIVGCAASGQVGRVGRLAGRSLAVILMYLSVAAIFAGCIAFPLFRDIHMLTQSKASAASGNVLSVQPMGFAAWVSDLIPANIFKAAAEGALLPLVLFSVAFGIVLSTMPADQKERLLGWFEAVREAFTRLIHIVLQTAPFGVFCLALSLPREAGMGGAAALLGYISVLSVVSGAFIVVVVYPSVALFAHIPFSVFVRAAAPVQALAFMSRSSLAALPLAHEAAKDGLAIPDEVSNFFFPFAASIFRVGG